MLTGRDWSSENNQSLVRVVQETVSQGFLKYYLDMIWACNLTVSLDLMRAFEEWSNMGVFEFGRKSSSPEGKVCKMCYDIRED